MAIRVEDGLLLLSFSTKSPPIVIVCYDEEKAQFRKEIDALAKVGKPWAKQMNKIISLQTIERKLKETGNRKWGRVETCPFMTVPKRKPLTPKKK